MINTIINFIKSLFIKDKEEPTMEALHNISIPRDDPFVFPYSGIDLVEEKEEMELQKELMKCGCKPDCGCKE